MSNYGKSAEKTISTVDRMTAAWGFSAVGPMIQINTLSQIYYTDNASWNQELLVVQ